MKDAHEYVAIMVTAPDLSVARQLVRLALEERLVACGNIIPGVESHYWWQGKLESNAEVVVWFKTAVSQINPLEELILAHHPYDTPEIVTLTFSHGTDRYVNWMKESLRPTL